MLLMTPTLRRLRQMKLVVQAWPRLHETVSFQKKKKGSLKSDQQIQDNVIV